jgi:hypothetical protein
MEKRCEKHIFEESEDRCGRCGQEYCAECLVYAFGPKKPPLCIPCAVAAAGIRSTAANAPILGKREMKAMHRERMLLIKRALKPAARAPEPEVFNDPLPSPVDTSVLAAIKTGPKFGEV